ncbi:hypothetical protein BJV77DRAFT_1016224 [Russula vinacea]|nr:hypothetical protein BJV77DRAFT_1016224 [Russula vinacea]
MTACLLREFRRLSDPTAVDGRGITRSGQARRLRPSPVFVWLIGPFGGRISHETHQPHRSPTKSGTKVQSILRLLADRNDMRRRTLGDAKPRQSTQVLRLQVSHLEPLNLTCNPPLQLDRERERIRVKETALALTMGLALAPVPPPRTTPNPRHTEALVVARLAGTAQRSLLPWKMR